MFHQQAARIFIIFVIIASATPGRSAPTEVYAPFSRCGRTVCDLREQYCDTVINRCTRCNDDCDPARITGNDQAISDCRKKCEWYYHFAEQAVQTTVVPADQYASLPSNGLETDHLALITVLVISAVVLLVVTIMLAMIIGLTYHLCCRSGSIRTGCGRLHYDSSVHCRAVDDVKLLKRNDKSFISQTSNDGPRIVRTSSDATCPKFPCAGQVHASSMPAALTYNNGSADNSLNPLLGSPTSVKI